MQLLRARHRALTWRPRFYHATLTNAVAESLSVTDAITVSWSTSAAIAEAGSVADGSDYPHINAANVKRKGRHRALTWQHRPGSGLTTSSAISESASIAATVSASLGSSAGISEAATLSDKETYPGGVPLAQVGYRGRSTPILWRQPEVSGSFNNYTAAYVESLSPSDLVSAVAAFAGNLVDALFPVDLVTSGAGPGGAGDYDDKKKKKKHKVKIGDRTIQVEDPAEAVNALNAQIEEEERRKQDDADLAFLLANL